MVGVAKILEYFGDTGALTFLLRELEKQDTIDEEYEIQGEDSNYIVWTGMLEDFFDQYKDLTSYVTEVMKEDEYCGDYVKVVNDRLKMIADGIIDHDLCNVLTLSAEYSIQDEVDREKYILRNHMIKAAWALADDNKEFLKDWQIYQIMIITLMI